MIALKVRKVGNSLGIVLPKETLKRLNIVEGETLYLTESFENGYRMTPYNENFSKQIAIAEEIMREDRDLLKELAKR
jgi:putative addiction module antidote